MSDQDLQRGFGRKDSNQATPIGKSYFLGIGINKYVHFRPLNNAVKDVLDIAAILIEQYDVDSENVRLLRNEEATRENIIHELDELSEKVGPDDKLIIYFSGHGLLKKRSDRGFWVPIDAQKGKTAQFIRNNTVLEYVEDINSRHTLLIADACFSGSLLDAKTGDDNLAMQEYERYRSRWILCSGRSNEMVSDGKPGQNSPFTQSILQVLKRNADSKLNIGKLADKVTTLTRSKDQQMPIAGPLRFAGDQNGQYVFTRQDKEEGIWADAEAKHSIAAYETYLAQFPNGKYKAKAEKELKLLYQKDAEAKEDAFWKDSLDENSKKAYEAYLMAFPNGKYIQQALKAIDDIRDLEAWKEAERFDDFSSYTKYLLNFSNGKYSAQAAERRQLKSSSYGKTYAPDFLEEKEKNTTRKPAEKPTKPKEIQPEIKPLQSGPNKKRIIQIGGGLLGLVLLVFVVDRSLPTFQDTAIAREPLSDLQARLDTLSFPTPKMIDVKGSTFKMGRQKGKGEDRELPVHEVTLSDFRMSQTEVTLEQYDAFCSATQRDKPSDQGWGRKKRPVINVSWYDAIEYCNWLSEQAGLTAYYSIDKTQKDPNNNYKFDNIKWLVSINEGANGFRLPTEAEWEYAARGGNQSKGYRYAGSDEPKTVAWYDENSSSKTQEVGLRQPNELGLYDMSGNVLEWCWDWYGAYSSSTQRNPTGASSGSNRVGRGGSWGGNAWICRVADRDWDYPEYRLSNLGFRVILP